METAALAAMVEACLPLLVTAGDYARAIQPHAAAAPKAGSNAWTQAITDADPSVQTFFEVATLAHFPEVGFYGEEEALSRNARHFPVNARTRFWLDPINGTYLYTHQRTGWDIILSISHDARLLAAISYMPMRGRFYLAMQGLGALTGTRNCRRLGEMEPLATRPGSGLCVTYRSPGELARLGHAFDAFDIVDDDNPNRPFENLDDLFTGRLDAYASREADLLDWGAMAFIATHAGGVASRLDGTPLDVFERFGTRATDLLVCTAPDVHARALAALRSDGR